VDVIATHSRALGRVFQRIAARILVSIGPVPSDVVAAGAGVPAEVRSRLMQGLQALRVGSLEFSVVRRGHFDLFAMLRRHVSEVGKQHPPLSHPARLDDQPRSPSRPVGFGAILDGVCTLANSYSSANDTSVT
jgi:hypothetical protein